MIIKLTSRHCLSQASKSANFNTVYIMNTNAFPREIITLFLLRLGLTHSSTEILENVSQI